LQTKGLVWEGVCLKFEVVSLKLLVRSFFQVPQLIVRNANSYRYDVSMFIFEGSMLASLTDTNTLYSLRAQLPDQSIRSTSLKSIHNLAMGSSYHMACALSKRNAAGTEPEQTLLTEFDVNSITIYPNPAYHQLHISAPAHYTTVELYDLIGNRVYFGSANSIISTSQLSNGIYLIKLHATDQSVVTQKVVIQHD
jgi:hypothetical protein